MTDTITQSDHTKPYKRLKRRSWVTAILIIFAIKIAFLLCNYYGIFGVISKLIGNGSKWNYPNHATFILIPIIYLLIKPYRRRLLATKFYFVKQQLTLSLILSSIIIFPPIIWEYFTNSIHLDPRFQKYILSTIIFQAFMVTIGEELYFRGFVQGYLNRSFGRKFRFGRTHFGTGLIVVSILFGLGHTNVWKLIFSTNLFADLASVNWINGLCTTFIAFALGLLRERYQSLLAPAIIHLAVNVNPVFFQHSEVGQIAAGFLSLAVMSFIIGFVFISPKRKSKPKSKLIEQDKITA